jgi:hypothetical protein
VDPPRDCIVFQACGEIVEAITGTEADCSQIVGVRILLWLFSLFINMDHAQWDDDVSKGLHFLEHSVLQVPFFLMTMMRYITPTLDEM